jgi:cell division protein FtsL
MKVLVLMGLVVVSLLVYVAERVDIVRLGYQIERLKTERAVLQRERDELRVKVSKLSSPERIAHLATDRLGMMQPRKDQVVLVHVGSLSPVTNGTAGFGIQLARHVPSK